MVEVEEEVVEEEVDASLFVPNLFIWILGNCPKLGRSPVEWGDFPFVCHFVRSFIRPSICPPPLSAIQSAIQPARPEAQPARPENQPARLEAQPASQPSLRL